MTSLHNAAELASVYDVESAETYLLHRLSQGVPEGSVDIPPEQAFPMDSNMDVMGGCEFSRTSVTPLFKLTHVRRIESGLQEGLLCRPRVNCAHVP